jgi:hypothetical protein
MKTAASKAMNIAAAAMTAVVDSSVNLFQLCISLNMGPANSVAEIFSFIQFNITHFFTFLQSTDFFLIMYFVYYFLLKWLLQYAKIKVARKEGINY